MKKKHLARYVADELMDRALAEWSVSEQVGRTAVYLQVDGATRTTTVHVGETSEFFSSTQEACQWLAKELAK